MTTPQMSAPTAAGDGQGAGGAAATASPAPFTVEEFDSIVGTIWGDLEEDQFRVGDLLADALAFIAGLALAFDTAPGDAARAAAVLREMEQRALWGPDHEQEDHR